MIDRDRFTVPAVPQPLGSSSPIVSITHPEPVDAIVDLGAKMSIAPSTPDLINQDVADLSVIESLHDVSTEQLIQEVEESTESLEESTSHTNDTTPVLPSVLVPTNEYQVIQSGQAITPGFLIEANLSTGVNRAIADPNYHLPPCLTSYPCEYCDHILSSKEDLKSHTDQIHKYHFSTCKIQLPTLAYLNQHIHASHPGMISEQQQEPDNHKCDKCDSTFDTSAKLQAHTSSHITTQKMSSQSTQTETIPPSYECHICNFISDNVKNLCQHFSDTHQEMVLTCKICQNKSQSISSLQDHIMVEHPPTESYTCDVCNTNFTQIEALQKQTSEQLTQPVNPKSQV